MRSFKENMQQEILSEAKLGNWKYRLPTDKEERLYDFYFMTMFFGRKITDMDIRSATDEIKKAILPNLKKDLLESVFFSLCAEFRHATDRNAIDAVIDSVEKALGKQHADHLLKFYEVLLIQQNVLSKSKKLARKMSPDVVTRSRDGLVRLSQQEGSYVQVYKAAATAFRGKKDMFVEICSHAYFKLRWNSSYGGKAWGGIAKGWQRLKDAKAESDQIVAIDHIYDLQHNTGSVFTKVKEYYKGGYGWLKRALDYKRDIKDPFGLYYKISGSMRTMAGYSLKHVYGTTLEDWIKAGGKVPHVSGSTNFSGSVSPQSTAAYPPPVANAGQEVPSIGTDGLKKGDVVWYDGWSTYDGPARIEKIVMGNSGEYIVNLKISNFSFLVTNLSMKIATRATKKKFDFWDTVKDGDVFEITKSGYSHGLESGTLVRFNGFRNGSSPLNLSWVDKTDAMVLTNYQSFGITNYMKKSTKKFLIPSNRSALKIKAKAKFNLDRSLTKASGFKIGDYVHHAKFSTDEVGKIIGFTTLFPGDTEADEVVIGVRSKKDPMAFPPSELKLADKQPDKKKVKKTPGFPDGQFKKGDKVKVHASLNALSDKYVGKTGIVRYIGVATYGIDFDSGGSGNFFVDELMINPTTNENTFAKAKNQLSKKDSRSVIS